MNTVLIKHVNMYEVRGVLSYVDALAHYFTLESMRPSTPPPGTSYISLPWLVCGWKLGASVSKCVTMGNS